MTKQEAELVVTKELDANERLLWAGVPKQGFLLRSSDAGMIPFSLLWCGFTFYWESLVVKTNGPLFFKLWGAMFMLVGLYIVFGRFFVDAWQRGVTAYALTDRRALIRSGLFTSSVESLALRTLPDVTSRGSSPSAAKTRCRRRRASSGSTMPGPSTSNCAPRNRPKRTPPDR
jgi:hypothetical protein